MTHIFVTKKRSQSESEAGSLPVQCRGECWYRDEQGVGGWREPRLVVHLHDERRLVLGVPDAETVPGVEPLVFPDLPACKLPVSTT